MIEFNNNSSVYSSYENQRAPPRFMDLFQTKHMCTHLSRRTQICACLFPFCRAVALIIRLLSFPGELIRCTNSMIYCNRRFQGRIIQILHFMLRPLEWFTGCDVEAYKKASREWSLVLFLSVFRGQVVGKHAKWMRRRLTWLARWKKLLVVSAQHRDSC